MRNPENGEVTIFPCEKWLSRQKEDGEIMRVLYPLSLEPSKSPKGSFREEPRREKSPMIDRNMEQSRERQRRREMDWEEEQAMMEKARRAQRDPKIFGFDENIGRNRREKTNFDDGASPSVGEREFYSRSPRYLR